MIYIKKFIVCLLCALFVSCLFTEAFAVTTEDLESQIVACQEIKETSHQMAECARKLGFSEDHIIIQTAKEKWNAAFEQEQDLTRQIEELNQAVATWNGPKLTRSKGVNYGPTGKETYYNLPMQGVVRIMRRMGYSEAEYPYWVRNDGVKMLGEYVMVAANFNHFPRGSIVECSLGTALVCDTGHLEWNQHDIAVTW